MALLESAIGGVAVTVLEGAFKAGGAVAKQIKGAYTETQAVQKSIEAAQKYAERYDKRHCQVKIMPGLMKEPLPLEEIYTAVKILDDQTIRYFIGLDDLEETYRAKGKRSFGLGDAERLDGMKVANTESFLMVLGGPGIGKSTFLRKIGLEALKKDGQIQRDCIPVMVELKELRDANLDLEQKIAAEFEVCGFPNATAFTEASLAQGKLLVLLDGLDEVPTHNLNRVIEHIKDFVDAHDNNAFIASCRIAAYRGSQSGGFQRFTDVTLAEFDDDQIEQFIRRWFRSEQDQEAGTADRYWELLQKDEHKATKELAQTPLLLTFLCLVYDRQQLIPAQRSILYGDALDILLSEWAAQKRLEQNPIYEGFHPNLEKVLLAQIAYDSFEQDQLFFLEDDITHRISDFLADTLDAPKYLDGAAVLQAIERQQGILAERAANIYSFSHLTLQEYLTAFHIKEEGLETELVAQHLTDERWREVFLLISGLLNNKAIDLLQAIEVESRSYLTQCPAVIKLIRWAERSTIHSSGKIEPAVRRATALALAIKSTRTQRRGRDRDSDMTRTIATALSSATANNIDIDVSIANALTRAGTIAEIRALAYALARMLTLIGDHDGQKAKDSVIALSLTLSKVSDGDVLSPLIFTNSKFAELPVYLRQMAENIPDENGVSQDWQNWANKLETLWLDSLGLSKEELTFNQEEAKALQNYLYATELLLQCKAAAIRIPRQAWTELEARLLTWPDTDE